jgi:dGTPase
VDDIYNAGQTIVSFSSVMNTREKELKRFMFANMYRHENVLRVRAQAEDIIRDLFDRYMQTPSEMRGEWADRVTKLDRQSLAYRVSDFLAGMTDNFAHAEHRRLFDQTPELR